MNNYNNDNINTKKINDLNKYIKILSWKNKEYNNFIYKNRNISRNNPGYLYYKEILNMNKTMQGKKKLSVGRTLYSRFNSNEKPKNVKHRSFTNIFNREVKSLKDCINVNNPYMPFWLTKIILNKNPNDLKRDGHIHFLDRINHKNNLFAKTKTNFHPMKNRTLDFCDKVKRKYLLNDKQKIPKRIKQLQNKKYYQSAESLMNLKQFNLKNNINNNNKKDKIKENDFKFEDDIPISKEQEKQFYQIQKNFFQTRKEIIEEPEYLEEDN